MSMTSPIINISQNRRPTSLERIPKCGHSTRVFLVQRGGRNCPKSPERILKCGHSTRVILVQGGGRSCGA